jgi:hypothetical protein
MARQKCAIKAEDMPSKDSCEMECRPQIGNPRGYDPATREGTKTRRWTFVTQLSLLALLFPLVTLAAGTLAAANHVTCGMVVTTNITLERDLVCSGPGLIVGAHGIVIDLNDHTLFGSAPSVFGHGVDITAFNDVTLKNGIIDGFSNGVIVSGAMHTTVSRLEVRNSTGQNIGFGIALSNGSHDNLVEKNIVRDNNHGIIVSGLVPERNSILFNEIFHNSFTGILDTATKNTTIQANHIYGHGCFPEATFGIALRETDAVIRENAVTHNCVGVFVEDTDGATIERNKLSHNGIAGLFTRFDGSSMNKNLLIIRNRADWNGHFPEQGGPVPFFGAQDGIFARGSGVILKENRAQFNARYGIFAEFGVVDGGGNRARNNGNPAQCLGVEC